VSEKASGGKRMCRYQRHGGGINKAAKIAKMKWHQWHQRSVA